MPRSALCPSSIVVLGRSSIVVLASMVVILAARRLESAEVQAGQPGPNITAIPRVAADVAAAIQDRRFAEAIKLIDNELKKPAVRQADFLLYLRGRAQTELALYEPALATFQKLEREFPKSDWVHRSAFGAAEVFSRQRNYQEAGKIYQREAERLLSSGRRDDLAAIYLEFADRFFDGFTDPAHPAEKRHDYPQALAFYQHALSASPGTEKRRQIELRIARCQHEIKNLPAAISGYQAFLARYGADANQKNRAPLDVEVEVRYRLGRALLDAHHPAEARKVWQDLLDAPSVKSVGGRFLAKAQFELSRTYGIPQPKNDGDLELGVAVLDNFLKAYSRDRLAPAAELDVALAYGARGRFDQAIARLRSMIGNQTYASAEQMPEARNLLGEILFSQKKFDDAISAWRDFLTAHPNHRGFNGVLERIADAEYARAEEQLRRRNHNAALELWEAFVKAHPLDERIPSIYFQFGQMKYAEGADRVKQRAAESAETGKPLELVDAQARALFEQAIGEWTKLIGKFAGSSEAQRAAVMIGVVLEERLGRLADAIEAYKRAGEEGQRRITRLTERQMEIITPRKFRTKEHAFVRLTTRNVEKVTVKVYRVELTDYFRKMHLASAIENLDIALIDPDRTFDFAVKDYEKYRPFEKDVELPINGPGAWAVTVSSDKLEATTMVVVSDLDVVVKGSRNELFVFAEDVALQKPAAGVRLLVSDGSRIFAEETTDREGIVQKSFDELKTVKDLRVFAVRDGHVASTVASLEGLDFAVGLSPVGHIFTDRPAYRRGELANLRGMIRWVADDRLTFKEGEAYKLEVTDPRGRVIHAADVKLGRFGTFAANFSLPETVPQGQCAIRVFQPAGKQSYSAQFEIHEAKLEQIRLQVDLPRKVYYRGEKIEGKIRLRHYYGTPLAGREVRYRLADDRIQTGTTNAAGELAIELPTRRYSESQPLELAVEFPEHNIRTVERVFLAARGFDIRVSTVRSVYVSGETFDATVTVADPAGDPVAASLKLELLEKTSSNRRSGERLVETFEIKSDKDKGTARQTVRVDKAGRYVLRATAVDRFGTAVSGSRDVMISGADDEIRLRILADRHNFQTGDTAHVTLHWRQPPALALVAYEGASILGHRLVELKTGANAFDFPLEAKLVPNFVLSVAVIDQTRFHQASSDFNVARKLRITVKPGASTVKPGEKLTVEVAAADPQGKPVVAEISLAMVQRNLLDAFAAKSASLDQLFGNGARKSSVRTMSSCTFLYHPETHGLSEALLAEDKRRQNELLESGSRERLADAPAAPGRRAATELYDYETLLKAGRYSEAEALAIQASELDPRNSALQLLRAQARLARQIGKNAENFTRADALVADLGEPRESSNGADSDWSSILNRGLSINQRMTGGMGGMFGGGIVGMDSPASSLPALAEQRQGQRTQVNGALAPTDSSSRADTSNAPSYRAARRKSAGPAMQRMRSFQSQAAGVQMLREDDRKMPASSSDSGKFEDGMALHGRYLPQQGQSWFLIDKNGLTLSYVPESSRTAAAAPAGAFPEGMLGETGYWNPAVITGADGKASVTFILPDRSTAWKLRAAGIDGEALAGDADADVVAKKDFFGQMKLPPVFTAGDRADVLVDVQNASVEKGAPIEVRLKVTLGAQTTELKKSLVSAGPGVESMVFPASFAEAGTAEFELSVQSGARRDVARASVPVRPFGLPVFSTASGAAGQSTIALVDVDRRLNPENPQLEILIGPSVDRSLLDAVLGSGVFLHGCDAVLPTSSLERATSDVIGGVALLAMVRGTRTDDTPEATALSVRVRAAIAQLVAAQRDDGGWSWSGGDKAAASDRYLTSRVSWAFAAARRAGFAVSPGAFEKATAYLSGALASAGPTEREVQAALFHALTECGKGDFAIANRLYRERNSLQPAGLLHVALALARLDRKEMAGELLALVRISIDPAAPRESAKAPSPVHGGVELRSLYLLAVEDIQPASEKAAKLADWLMAARQGSRWNPERANGPAIAAVAQWFGRVKQTREKYTLTVYVNDRLLQKIAVDPSVDSSRRLEVPGAMLVQGRPQRINFDLEGRGRFSYSAVLSGFVPAERLAATTQDWLVDRWYEPAQRMLDGEIIPRGFDVLAGSYTTFRNDLTQLPVGARGEVTLNVYRRSVRGTPDESRDYLVIAEPIPAGTTVLPDSVQGTFERYEISGGVITFYVGDVAYPGTYRYTLVGYAPGSFRAAPTVVRSFYDPQRIAVSTRKSLNVLPHGTASRDEYKLTPRELFELGKRLIAKGRFAEGADHLTRLLKGYALREDVYRDAVQALFRAALATGRNQAVVENFEIIKEKLPGVEIDFDSILRVALAYRALGEYERSFLVYRATVEAAFQRESQIAGFLDDRKQFLRSVQVMERLLREYPAEPYVAAATYALAQEIYGKAAGAAENDELRQARLTRVDLIAASITLLDHFVTSWPNDPAADQATFSAVSAHLDLEKYDAAIVRSRYAVSRYPTSKLADSFWYVIGYSQYALGRNDDALATCRKVAEMTRKDPQTGAVTPAENKWQAIYIAGQIFHSLGKPAQAVAEYERVKDKFADAREAIDFFLHRALSLPEVVTVKPNDQAHVTLTYRNIPRVDLKVYRIDLLKFGLLQRNLAKLTAINLAGIRPFHDVSLDLGDGKDYGDRQKVLSLPIREEGAYLVVCRGADNYASGVVLVSPLELAVQEDAESGRVRVTAKDAVADHYVRKVLVKVIGSENADFATGETDLRGIFTADAIRGTTTVIARADNNRYAFFRGTMRIGPMPQPARRASGADKDDAERSEGAPAMKSKPLLENLIRSNGAQQQQQRDSYRSLLRNRKQGVKAQEVF